MEDKQNESEPIVNHKTGQTKSELLANLPVPGPGRKPDTPDQKKERKAIKQLVAEYKQALAEALPIISPVLVAKAMQGDMNAIKELNDILVDKAPRKNEISGKDGGAIEVKGVEITIRK